MTPKEQEQLFLDLKTAHPTWSNQCLSGYAHGANDAARFARPKTIMRRRRDEYALGYLTGFAMRSPYYEDVERESWFHFVGDLIRDCKK